jgi:hypothetical protein
VSDWSFDLSLGEPFKSALDEMRALGVAVSTTPRTTSTPYAVIGGRSNARWWLLPLDNGKLIASSLALFQPVLPSAALMKRAAIALSKVGLHKLWAKPRLHLSGTPSGAKYFGASPLSFAYFTGTESAHRKLAVQVMDSAGSLKGYVKASRSVVVRNLLAHEASTLARVQALGLRSALIPDVLFLGDKADIALLVTNTLKRPNTTTTTRMNAHHDAFIRELAQKTVEPGSGDAQSFQTGFQKRLKQILGKLPETWIRRFESAIDQCGGAKEQTVWLRPSLTHGDFTPWNSFFVDGKLYVFDWEYAQNDMPATNDLLHFLLASLTSKRRRPRQLVKILTEKVGDFLVGAPDAVIRQSLLIYLINHSLRHVERSDDTFATVEERDGLLHNAALMDVLLLRQA